MNVHPSVNLFVRKKPHKVNMYLQKWFRYANLLIHVYLMGLFTDKQINGWTDVHISGVRGSYGSRNFIVHVHTDKNS